MEQNAQARRWKRARCVLQLQFVLFSRERVHSPASLSEPPDGKTMGSGLG